MKISKEICIRTIPVHTKIFLSCRKILILFFFFDSPSIQNFCLQFFFVACTRLHNPLCPSVGPSFGRSVRHTLLFRCLWAIFALLPLPKCLVRVFLYCPCPPAHDWRSRVYGLVCTFALHFPVVIHILSNQLIAFPVSSLLYS